MSLITQMLSLVNCGLAKVLLLRVHLQMKQVLCPEAKDEVMMVSDGWSYFITVALHLLLLEARKSGARVR